VRMLRMVLLILCVACSSRCVAQSGAPPMKRLADYRGRERIPARGRFPCGRHDRAAGPRIRLVEYYDPHGHGGADKEKAGVQRQEP
jgi:hypothetical protein